MKLRLLLPLVVLLCGCVTTETGGIPKAKSEDDRVKAHLDLARGYLAKADIARARRPLEQALKIEPNSVEANTLMATVLQVEGEDQLAEESFKKAIRYGPDSAMAHNNYGTFLYSKGRYEEARKNLLIAVKDTSYSARAQAYENLGLTEVKLGATDDAEKTFQRALMLSSEQSRSMLELSDLYFQKGNYPASKQYFDWYGKTGKSNARTLWLGIRLSRVFEDQNALASYALALKNLYPGSDEYKAYLESIK